MINTTPDAAARARHWSAEFCADYAPAAFDLAWWFLVVALVAGVIGALLEAWARFRAPPAVAAGEAGGAAALPAMVTAIKGLIDGFSKAPAWLALLGSGLFLFWLAGNAVPAFCLLPEDRPASREADENGQDATPDPGNAVAPSQAGTTPDAPAAGKPAPPSAAADPEAGG